MKSKVWVYPGMGGWRFLVLSKKDSKRIKDTYGDLHAGFGSLPVTATIGKTIWKTSIFPDKKIGAYLLPLKSEVRKKELISDNSLVTFNLEVRI